MKLFHVYIDAGDSVFKTFTAAKSKKAMIDRDGGNGKFVKIEDVTMDYLTDESADCLYKTLISNHWGQAEATIISELVREHVARRS